MSAFKNYVTSSAFNLSLSKAMIEALSMVHQYGVTYCNLSTYQALKHRGLVDENKEVNNDLPSELKAELRKAMCLTDAGKALIPLLKISGLYTDFNRPIKGEYIGMPCVTIKE